MYLEMTSIYIIDLYTICICTIYNDLLNILWYKIYQGDHINMKELSPSRFLKKKILPPPPSK